MEHFKESEDERRETFRLDIRVPAMFRPLTPQEVGVSFESSIKDAIGELQFQSLPKTPKPVDIPAYLSVMNQKLDMILKILVGGKDAGIDLAPYNISLSESGVGFESEERFDMEQLMEIKMVLPDLGKSILFQTYGEVKRVEPKDGRWLIGLEFVHMPEWMRAHIGRVILDKQRGTTY